MENLSYSSYPDSANSSPHSRDVDETHSFEEPPPAAVSSNNNNYKVKFMCSYGGKIQPRPHDNQLAYIGGDTKILAVERNIKFSLFISKFASLCNTDHHHICFKYQLPGEDLDALISVTNDEDLEHMMLEYDRLYRASAKPARLRLFLFQLNPSNSFGSDDAKSERQWFVDALNSVPVQVSPGNADFLFGSEKAVTVEENQQISPDLERLQIADTHEHVFNRKIEEANSRVYPVEYHQQKVGEIATPPAAQVAMPVLMQVPAPYLPERHVSYAIPGNEQTVYQVPYHHTPTTLRPVIGQVGQGCYGMQQPVYNMVPPPLTTSATAVASLPQQQQQQQLGMYSEGTGMVQMQPKVEQGYLQVGYDSAGRQVYYTQQFQAMAAPPPATVPVGAALNQDGMVQVVGGGANVMGPQTSSV
ncbi:uncharacterized protein LOC8280325 [Ricinus communis]|uniref:PB1 domain-containing protein n=1 Tax=Ricinus communis TaxID=3988 RepID=B9SMX3_RICCO|nr:uncharacterized protein LOC8280325 [Ricinus communis]EEF35014.1 hypothetical protein RCOM_0482310 [Ricinus communis]|eukprot:XP_002527342.1 uncharacterized protein LOC8280325 [Ricinus communis]